MEITFSFVLSNYIRSDEFSAENTTISLNCETPMPKFTASLPKFTTIIENNKRNFLQFFGMKLHSMTEKMERKNKTEQKKTNKNIEALCAMHE